MPTRKGLLTWAGWAAGALAVALAFSIPQDTMWPDQLAETPLPEHAGRPTDQWGTAPSGRAGADLGRANPPTPEVLSDQAGKRETKVPRDESSPLANDPGRLYQSLMSPDRAEKDLALQTVSRHAEDLYAYNAIYQRITTLTADNDPLIAERARQAGYRVMALRTAYELPEPSALDTNPDQTWPGQDGKTGSRDPFEKAGEPLDSLQERALNDPDPAVRLGGIEAAVNQQGEDSLDLLWAAALGDIEPDNRLSAVSEVEQILKIGLVDGDQILALLEETVADPDPRVAELSVRIIQERFEGPEETPQIEENENLEAGSDIATAIDEPEIAVWPIETLQEQAILNPDPAVRLGGIESVMSQSDAHGFDLLREAAVGDTEPENRLSAVGELEQMLKSGMGDSNQILELLQQTAADPDPRVAELSELIIQEQQKSLEAPPQGSETETTFDLIWESTLEKLENSRPDNRLSAVSDLGQMIRSGMGDSDQILQLLEHSTMDPDPRVAQMAASVIQEQRNM